MRETEGIVLRVYVRVFMCVGKERDRVLAWEDSCTPV